MGHSQRIFIFNRLARHFYGYDLWTTFKKENYLSQLLMLMLLKINLISDLFSLSICICLCLFLSLSLWDKLLENFWQKKSTMLLIIYIVYLEKNPTEELWVCFIQVLAEDYSLGDSCSALRRLLWRNRGEASIYRIFWLGNACSQTYILIKDYCWYKEQTFVLMILVPSFFF